MKFTQLELKNWAVFRGITTIPLESTSEKPIILIKGNNDMGKTSLFYAIKYALYGHEGLLSHPKVNYRRIQEWPNFYSANEGEGELCVELSMQVENNSIIRIQRKRKFRQTPIGEEITVSPEDELTIFENDKPSTTVGKTNKEINRWIQIHILPIDASQFFLFDGEVIQKYTESPSENVQKAIEQVLGLSEIRNAENNLSRLLEDIQEERSRKARLESKDQKMSNSLELLSMDIKNLKTLINGARNEMDSAEKIIDENNKVINQYTQLRDKKTRQKELLDRIKTKKLTLGEFKVELIDKRNYGGLLLANSLLKIISITDETPSSLVQWESQTSAYLIDNKIESCVCGTKIDSIIRNELGKKILQLKQNPFSNLKRLGEHIAASYRPDAIDVQLNNLVNNISDIEDEIKLDDEEVERISKDIKNNPDIGEELKDKENKNHSLRKEIGVLENQIVINEKKLLHYKGKEQNLTSQIIQSSVSKDLKKLTEQEQYVEKVIHVFSKSFQDYYIIQKPKLEKVISGVFMKLTNAPDKYKAIHLTSKFEIVIERMDGVQLPAHRYSPSAGAGQIAVTAVIAGFNKFSTRKAPVVIDTPAGRLDPIHTENLLEYYPEMSAQVIILPQLGEISREDEKIISDFVSNRYSIEPKVNDVNQSRIVRDIS